MGPTEDTARLGPPFGWLECPRHGKVLNGFIPLKTPLCDLYDNQIPKMDRFYVSTIFNAHKHYQAKIGLWIDLTNTDRYYYKEEVKNCGAEYDKLNCKGHDKCPDEEQTRKFIDKCKNFWKETPDSLIAVHCTHGFNRTGFLIVSYLVNEKSWSVKDAVRAFSNCRPPGIYKQDYLKELFKRHDSVENTPLAPALPAWRDDSEPVFDNNEAEANSNRPSTSNKASPAFIEGLPQVTLVKDSSRVKKVQETCRTFCKWFKQGFPGSQPVSMDKDNIRLLQQRSYEVTLKADGVRYMMMIDGENEVYMIDRENNVFHVPSLRFPHRKEDRHIKGTLVDGELVFDKVGDKKLPRYLIFDIVRFEEQPAGDCDFGRRKLCIEREIIGPRDIAKAAGSIVKLEPFNVEAKEFCNVTKVEKLLNSDYAKSVPHDGLIFQPFKPPYEPGRCESILKWKPHELNSVDFKLMINWENKEGMMKKRIGYLYVLHHKLHYATMKVTPELMQYDNKIIECSLDDTGRWKLLRERCDKSYPNAYATAEGVCKSIRNRITKEYLINFIQTEVQNPIMSNANLPPSLANGISSTQPSVNGTAKNPAKKRCLDDGLASSSMPPPFHVLGTSKQ